LLPRWLTRLGALSGLLMVGSAVALFVDRGILEFGGVVDIAGGIPAFLWIAALSVVMVLDTRAGAAAAGPAAC
jgi:ABC-type sulfate transport system permease component